MFISRLNLRLVQIGRKPPLFYLLVRYSARIVSHDITLLKHISHIIDLIEDLAEKPLPQAAEQGNFFRLDLSISCNFQQLWFSWQKPPQWPKRENNLDWIYQFHAISSNFGSAGRKAMGGICDEYLI